MAELVIKKSGLFRRAPRQTQDRVGIKGRDHCPACGFSRLEFKPPGRVPDLHNACVDCGTEWYWKVEDDEPVDGEPPDIDRGIRQVELDDDEGEDILQNLRDRGHAKAPPAIPEAVHHPSHYGGDTTYETIKVLQAWLTHHEFIGFLKGNAIKYNSRATKKGNAIEDYRKSLWYQTYLDNYLKDHVG